MKNITLKFVGLSMFEVYRGQSKKIPLTAISATF